MHDTIIPEDNPNPHLRGTIQKMNFDDDLPSDHPDYKFKGQPKGMRRILEERGLWHELVQKNGGKALLGDCEECKLSQKAKDKRAQELAESMAGIDEPEEAENDSYVPPTGSTCCMRKVLSEQADFRSEKPLLQIVIEKAGHKCYFLPKFHCELNPIEMVWGWAKIRAFFPSFISNLSRMHAYTLKQVTVIWLMGHSRQQKLSYLNFMMLARRRQFEPFIRKHGDIWMHTHTSFSVFLYILSPIQ